MCHQYVKCLSASFIFKSITTHCVLHIVANLTAGPFMCWTGHSLHSALRFCMASIRHVPVISGFSGFLWCLLPCFQCSVSLLCCCAPPHSAFPPLHNLRQPSPVPGVLPCSPVSPTHHPNLCSSASLHPHPILSLVTSVCKSSFSSVSVKSSVLSLLSGYPVPVVYFELMLTANVPSLAFGSTSFLSQCDSMDAGKCIDKCNPDKCNPGGIALSSRCIWCCKLLLHTADYFLTHSGSGRPHTIQHNKLDDCAVHDL